MRSTVDILDAVDSRLRELARANNLTYKEALNRVVAAGLSALERQQGGEAAPYRVEARACGFRSGVDPAHLNRLADELDDEERFGTRR